MPSFNQVTLMGNLTRDPELRYTPGNAAVVSVGLAVNEKWKDAQGVEKEKVHFIDLDVWGKRGEVFAQYLHKGDPVFVQGRLNHQTWEDKQGGGKRSKLTVTVEDFRFIGSKGGNGGNGGNGGGGEGERAPSRGPAGGGQRPPRNTTGGRPSPEGSPIGEEQHFRDDDIPF